MRWIKVLLQARSGSTWQLAFTICAEAFEH
jgi:hypothetical protein